MKKFILSFTFMALCLLAFYMAGKQHSKLLFLRDSLDLNAAPPLENTTPLVAFTTVALGGFRGIIADILWMRSSRLQEEGKYFELTQLAKWITQLEPRFPEVWAFQAWNMSYNISVLFNDAEDRWRWVYHGICLLRDEGLKHNPTNAKLYWELGWIYQHKIGQNMDQMHTYYKEQLATMMDQLFNGPGPNYKALDATPPSSEDIRLKNEMKDRFNLDPDFMQEVDKRYGPFDWRLPNAHAVYWAHIGQKYARNFDQVKLQRMIFHNLSYIFSSGRLTLIKGIPFQTPNFEMLDSALEAYHEAIIEKPNEQTFKTAHKNFLANAVMTLYAYHYNKRARKIFEELHRQYPHPLSSDGFEEFIYKTSSQTSVDTMSQDEAMRFVEGHLYQSYAWESLNKINWAAGYRQKAALIWRKYMRARMNSPEFSKRTGLPDFKELSSRAHERFLEESGKANTTFR